MIVEMATIPFLLRTCVQSRKNIDTWTNWTLLFSMSDYGMGSRFRLATRAINELSAGYQVSRGSRWIHMSMRPGGGGRAIEHVVVAYAAYYRKLTSPRNKYLGILSMYVYRVNKLARSTKAMMMVKEKPTSV